MKLNMLKGDLDDFVRVRMNHVNKASILITFADWNPAPAVTK